MGIQSIKTSPYHPESNGVIERMHGTLKKVLKKAGAKATTWDTWINQVMYALRISPHSSTGYPPFQLLFGRKPETPLTSFRRVLEDPSPDLPQPVYTYLLNLQQKMQLAQEAAAATETQSKKDSKLYQDTKKKAQESLLEPGSYVLSLEPKKSTGLSAEWQGPFIIKKRSGLTSYTLDIGHGKELKRHRNALKPYHPEVVSCCSIIAALPDAQAQDGVTLEQHCTEDNDNLDLDLSHLTQDLQQQFLSLITEFKDIFSDIPKPSKFLPYHLDTGDQKPISQQPYRPGLQWKEKLQEAVDKLLQAGFIRPSQSPWSSPVIPVPKPDGSIRLVVDYRKLNSCTATDKYPLPRVDELLAQVGQATCLTTLDLSQGYHQILLDDTTIPKTAFITSAGKFEFLRLPFGLKNAPSYFQRCMDKALQNHPATPYLDDIAIPNDSWDQHFKDLREVFQVCRKNCLSLKLKKCKFGNGTLNYLGHTVGSGKILPQDIKLEAILHFPQPRTKKQLQSFLGLVGYYREHIPNYSTRAASLSDLLKKTQPDKIKWTDALTTQFLDVRSSILDSPLLIPPNPDKTFHLFTDASGVGLGAVLKQEDINNKLQPIGFYSYKLKTAEAHYSVIELEAYAIVKALLHFAAYLRGSKLVIHTDHRALKFLTTMKNTSQRLMRWAAYLQMYDYTIEHLPGIQNLEADALSRTWEDTIPTSGPFRGGGCWDPPTSHLEDAQREFPAMTPPTSPLPGYPLGAKRISPAEPD